MVFLCAGPEDRDPDIAALAMTSLDWEDVASLAITARALPIVVRRVKQALGGRLPPRSGRLQQLALVEEFELSRMQERFEETLAAFDRAGIPTVLLKGAALARSVYRSVPDRPMRDLDVLVPPFHAESARAVALSTGWVLQRDVRPEGFYRTHHHLPPFTDARGTRAFLEVHTGLFPLGNPFHLDGLGLRARAREVNGRAPHAWVPSPEDHLIHLCTHWAWSHVMTIGAWRAFRDVQALAERGGLDWELALTKAREARATTCLYWTLRMARTLCGARLPAGVLRALEPPTLHFALDLLERHFAWQLAEERPCPSVKLGEMLWTLAIRPRWSDHGKARPWTNPETAPWSDASPRKRSAAHRLAASVAFAVALLRA